MMGAYSETRPELRRAINSAVALKEVLDRNSSNLKRADLGLQEPHSAKCVSEAQATVQKDPVRRGRLDHVWMTWFEEVLDSTGRAQMERFENILASIRRRQDAVDRRKMGRDPEAVAEAALKQLAQEREEEYRPNHTVELFVHLNSGMLLRATSLSVNEAGLIEVHGEDEEGIEHEVTTGVDSFQYQIASVRWPMEPLVLV